MSTTWHAVFKSKRLMFLKVLFTRGAAKGYIFIDVAPSTQLFLH